jgi:hypothetical protein
MSSCEVSCSFLDGSSLREALSRGRREVDAVLVYAWWMELTLPSPEGHMYSGGGSIMLAGRRDRMDLDYEA